jgi:hypothetical protein
MDKLQEDTVSADRKERIIFDADAWRKKDKSGKKTSAITSRQNFDNEKFTRNAQDKVDEGTIQPSGDSKVDSAGPTQSDTISKEKHKKSNNPQIEFVSGTAQPNGSSSTATGNAQASATGRKIAEALVKKALDKVNEGKMGEKAAGDLDFHAKAKKDDSVPFDGPYTKTPSTVVDKSGAKHTPYSRVRSLARQAMNKQAVKEQSEIEEGVAGAVAGGFLGAIAGPLGVAAGGYLGHKIQQGANASKSVKKKIVKEEETDMSNLNKEGYDPEQFGSDGSGAGRPGGAGAGDIGKADKKKKSAKSIKEGSKTYADFIQQLQEYNAGKDGVYRHKGTYGGSYDSNDDHDEDEPKKPAAPAVKRGRGRPAGSKSGANQKVTTGKSYGGIATHSLSLPNR